MKVRGATADNRRIWLFITQCAWCRGIKVWRWYVRRPKPPLLVWREQLHLPHLPVVVVSMTHGACPQCAQRVNERAGRSRQQRTPSTRAARVGREDAAG